ncbi:four-carbon acid sugar kinase family protein [Algibacter mikhailovii]|uniref:four-carbon acid sugar kinase family protein n=1 Tax=Algibacter mikhailovii TaxID=425498 RepID=UPI0024956157|nr:four-carbon acid sugar kinase family protein [Algibacter mikhailovii]
MSILEENIIRQLPTEDKSLDYRATNNSLFSSLDKTCIVIDDDPTGNQTVYDIPLLTNWEIQTLVDEFKKRTPTFFLLTNSRSLSASQSKAIYAQIAQNILAASKLVNRDFTLISRSDSTLRGHFFEIETLQLEVGENDAVTMVIPVMFEGGRVTVNDNHYIQREGVLTPVNETPFSQDHTFGYKHANLKKWIEEKTHGKIKTKSIYAISIDDIRTKNLNDLVEDIINMPSGAHCIINALNYYDLDKATCALLQAQSQGKSLIYRTSSSFVPSYIGLKPKGLLKVDDIVDTNNKRGGLTIVGSYVPKSSSQLHKALTHYATDTIVEVDVSKVIGNESQAYLRALLKVIDNKLENGQDVIVFTSRKLVTGKDAGSNINIAKQVSNALVYLVQKLKEKPKYLLAKGGITSNDLALQGLGMKQSKVLGQIEAGIPVWEMGSETKFPKLLYIVFPGNVGDEHTLLKIITKLN